MQENESWPYKPYESLNVPVAIYKIWIFAADRLQTAHSPGKSGCAWEIRDERDVIIESPNALVTDRPESKQWRGYIAAATRSVERLPNGSTAIICCRNTTFLKSIEAVNENKRNGWRTKKNRKIDAVDIWERFLLARDGDDRRPKAKMVMVREPSSALDFKIIKLLQRRTSEALDLATGK